LGYLIPAISQTQNARDNKGWLVVSTPLKNMNVTWDYYSQYMESHKSHAPNHQPEEYRYITQNDAHKVALNLPPFRGTGHISSFFGGSYVSGP